MLKSKHTVPVGPMSVGRLWGRRLKDSVTRWSLQVNEDTLLDCFRHRPGTYGLSGAGWLSWYLYAGYALDRTGHRTERK